MQHNMQLFDLIKTKSAKTLLKYNFFSFTTKDLAHLAQTSKDGYTSISPILASIKLTTLIEAGKTEDALNWIKNSKADIFKKFALNNQPPFSPLQHCVLTCNFPLLNEMQKLFSSQKETSLLAFEQIGEIEKYVFKDNTILMLQPLKNALSDYVSNSRSDDDGMYDNIDYQHLNDMNLIKQAIQQAQEKLPKALFELWQEVSPEVQNTLSMKSLPSGIKVCDEQCELLILEKNLISTYEKIKKQCVENVKEEDMHSRFTN